MEHNTTTLHCDLCVIGNGYAGINAVNAASHYLPKGSTIVCIARNEDWGGHWPTQYKYCTLHQPFEGYAVGDHKWPLARTYDQRSHLATRGEILNYFKHCINEIKVKKGIEIIELWGYEYRGHNVKSKKVNIMAYPLFNNNTIHKINVVANRLIKGNGYDLKVKAPFVFAESKNVNDKFHSLTANDVLLPATNALMLFSKDKDKPIYIIGSGKTAVDAMNAMSTELGSRVTNRMYCISGHGTYFMVRRGRAANANIKGMLMYNGSNEKDVFNFWNKEGFFHSPFPDPEGHMNAICSKAEVEQIKQVLSPANEKIFKAHLIDINYNNSNPQTLELILKDLRKNRVGTIMKHDIPIGSFIINCTDQYAEHVSKHEPIVSEDNLVLSPQTCLHGGGPSCEFLTHAWYLGTLDQFWRELPRVILEHDRKEKWGLQCFFQDFVSIRIAGQHLPKEVVDASGWGTLTRASFLPPNFDQLVAHMKKVLPHRYTDKNSFIEVKNDNIRKKKNGGGFGGVIGIGVDRSRL